MSDLFKRPKSIGEAWRIMIQQQARIGELEALCQFHIAESKKVDEVVQKENAKLKAENKLLNIKEWEQYFADNCSLPAAAIQDLFDCIERLQAQINRLSVSGTKDQIEIDELEAENERQATLIRELNEHYGGQADEIERLTAVVERIERNTDPDNSELMPWSYRQVNAAAREALAAEGVPEDMCCKDWPNCKEG